MVSPTNNSQPYVQPPKEKEDKDKKIQNPNSKSTDQKVKDVSKKTPCPACGMG